MSQVRTDAATPQSASGAQAGPARAPRARPLSPHLQVWRWHVTMAASIATRVAGFALFAGFLIACYVLVSLASGPDAYATAVAVVGSVLGKLVLFGITAALFYYMASGVRHFVWDSGEGFQPGVASRTAWFCFAFGAVAAVAVWAVAFLAGAA